MTIEVAAVRIDGNSIENDTLPVCDKSKVIFDGNRIASEAFAAVLGPVDELIAVIREI